MKEIILCMILFFSFDFTETFIRDSIAKDFSLICLMAVFGLAFVYSRSIKIPRQALVILALSFIMFFSGGIIPYYRYDQSFIGGWVAQRENLSVFILPVLFSLKPSNRQVLNSMKYISYLAIIIAVISIFSPLLFIDKQALFYLNERQLSGSHDIITAAPGAHLVFLLWLSQLETLVKTRKLNLAILISSIYIFLLQNRSTLIFVVALLIYLISTRQLKFGRRTFSIALVLGIIFSGVITDISLGLYEETVSQITSVDYARLLALNYFFSLTDWNLINYCFGFGVPAAGSNYLEILVRAQISHKAYLSDVGLLGSYFIYGIPLILAVYLMIKKALTKGVPLFCRWFAFFVILVPTIHGYGLWDSSYIILFAVWFFLSYNHHVTYNSAGKIH